MEHYLTPKQVLDNSLQMEVGGKAANLAVLSGLGCNVPHWVVLSKPLLQQ